MLVGAILLATGCSSQPAPASKDEAVRLVLAWLTGDGRLPGFDQNYPDAGRMKGKSPTFFVCEFLPADAVVTENPKFHRISQAEYDKAFRENSLEAVYAQGGYLRIDLAGESSGEVTLLVKNMTIARAGHSYRFVFRNDGAGLQVSGKMELAY
jgi:hypothetical protein